MILSTSHEVTVTLLGVAMLCWGLWANTLKIAGKWRFELYYLDFSAGFVLLTVLAAFTLGSLNSGELTFQDNLAIAGYRKIAFCLVAGFLLGIAMDLLAAGVVLTGMAVAFTISLGIGTVVGISAEMAAGVHDAVVLTGAGAAAILAAVIIAGYAHSARADTIQANADRAAFRPDPREQKARKQPLPVPPIRGIILSIISGVLIGLFQPVLSLGQGADDGVAPYGAALLVGAGLLAAALFFTPLFWNFPVIGRPLGVRDYMKSSLRNHLLGVAGGIIVAVGTLGFFIAGVATVGKQAGAALSFTLNHAGVLVAALCGVLAWKEFRAAESRTVLLFGAGMALFAIGIAMLALGQA